MKLSGLGKLILGISLFSATLAGSVFGNGGGYHYGVKFTGSIAPFTAEGTENVQILDEKLDVLLRANDAKVSVIYQMQNVTHKKVKVRFGFPVEDVKNEWDFAPLIKGAKKLNEPKYTQDYQVLMNGKKLKHLYHSEPYGVNKKKGIKPFAGSEKLAEIEGWMVSEFKLKPNEKFTIQITYLSEYDEAFSSVSDDSSTGALSFDYRLSTGAVWHGPIKKGVVTIVPTHGVSEKGVKIDKPVNRFKKEGRNYVWRFENLEPTLADDISVQAIPSSSSFVIYNENSGDQMRFYTQLGKKWYVTQDYKIEASSTLADQKGISYKAENLMSPWRSSWSEGAEGQGIGESLTLKLSKPTRVAVLSLINGYDKSDLLFNLNSRVKELEVTINGTVKEVLHLADNSHKMLYPLKYSKPISSLKLTVKSVYPGQKFEDTCLSYIGLLERLKKEPKNYGAR